jgi:hypothetical protein
VVPRAGADEEAADKPARSVIAVGSTRVRSVVVIAPRTDGSRVSISIIPVPAAITNSNADAHLRVRRRSKKRCGNHQGAEQHEVS